MEQTEVKFIVLKSIGTGEIFWSTFTEGSDPTRLDDGHVAYEVIGKFKTQEEAQECWNKHNPFWAALALIH